MTMDNLAEKNSIPSEQSNWELSIAHLTDAIKYLDEVCLQMDEVIEKLEKAGDNVQELRESLLSR